MDVPQDLKHLFEKKLVGIISTNNREGYPHSVPVWIALVDSKVYFSTYKSSQKAINIKRNPKCGMTVVDTPGGPYIHLQAIASVRTKEEFEGYREIVKTIMQRYVSEDKVEEFTIDRMENPERILFELDIEHILRNPFSTKNPDAEAKK